MQIDALVFEGSPQPLDEDVVEEPALAVHGNPHTGLPEGVGPGPGRKLAALVGVHDLRRAVPRDRLCQRIDAGLGIESVRQTPRQDLGKRPVFPPLRATI